MFVFFLALLVLDRLHFPQRARFYGFSAMLFGIAGILSAVLLDFAYVPFFLWASVFIVIGAIMANPIVIFISAIFVPAFAIIAFFNILGTGSTRLAELIIFSPVYAKEGWTVIIQVALLTLPVLLLFSRGIILFQKSSFKNIAIKRKNMQILLSISVVILAFAMILQILILKHTNPIERRFVTEILETGEEGDIISLLINDIVFQDSRILTINLEARGSPIRFDVSLESVNEKTILPVYSAPVPFERTYDGKRIDFALGEEPSNPFVMEIVLPLEFEGSLKTTAIYNTRDPEIDPGEIQNAGNYFLLVTRSVNLEATN
jgi:hypothetical protein